MKSIRFFKYALWAAVLFLFANSVFSVAYAAGDVNGKLTFVIEKKSYSQQEAVDLINNRTPVLLKVSLRMEGEWYTKIKSGAPVMLGSNQFSYAIVKDGGLKAAYESDPAAYMMSTELTNGTHCSDPLGNTLCIKDFYSGITGTKYPSLYISVLRWRQAACPNYAYELLFSKEEDVSESAHLHENAAGQYYELDLFYLPFILKRAETVYVRGIDGVRYNKADEDDYTYGDGGASTVTTELNLTDDGGRAYTIPCATSSSDWTSADANCYGGVLPGGIFIEQVPELTQFERSLMA